MRKEEIFDFFDIEAIGQYYLRTMEELSEEERRKIQKDPEYVERFLPKRRWVAILPLTIGVDWGKIEHASLLVSIRELLQNAYDEAEAEFGYSQIEAKTGVELQSNITADGKDLLVIWNESSKLLNPLHFFLTRFKEEEGWRGRFGMGMKIAISWFIENGYDVYILSGYRLYKFYTIEEMGKKLLVMCLGISEEGFNGTKYFIFGKFGDIESIMEYISIFEYLRRHPNSVFYSNSIIVGGAYKNQYIIDDDRGIIWINDMQLSDIRTEFDGKESMFSYAMWNVEVTSDRLHLTPIGRMNFREKIEGMIETMPDDVFENFISRFLERKVTIIGEWAYDTIFIKPYFETTVLHYSKKFAKWLTEKLKKEGKTPVRFSPEEIGRIPPSLLANIMYILPKEKIVLVEGGKDVNVHESIMPITSYLSQLEWKTEYYDIEELPYLLNFVMLKWINAVIVFLLSIVRTVYEESEYSIIRKLERMNPVVFAIAKKYESSLTLGEYSKREGRKYDVISFRPYWDLKDYSDEKIALIVLEEFMHYITEYLYYGSKDLTKWFEESLFAVIRDLLSNAFKIDDRMIKKIFLYPSFEWLKMFNEYALKGGKLDENFVKYMLSKKKLYDLSAFYDSERKRLKSFAEKMKEVIIEELRKRDVLDLIGREVVEDEVSRFVEYVMDDIKDGDHMFAYAFYYYSYISYSGKRRYSIDYVYVGIGNRVYNDYHYEKNLIEIHEDYAKTPTGDFMEIVKDVLERERGRKLRLEEMYPLGVFFAIYSPMKNRYIFQFITLE